MKRKINIKKAQKDDLNFVKKLLKKNNLPHEDINSKLDSLCIGCMGSEKIGIGGVEIYGKYGLLRSLVIKEPFRGKGYGKRLCLKIIEYSKLRGAKELYLLTTTAENFFKKIGFERTDRKIAPEIIKHTSEFMELCPASATCMMMKISRRFY